ncbi:ketopantoate reductase family protein [Neopusillimonas maritima]|uniref:2-dehydropantoate 2-reductase n=1 Tax=Neopusillimonas maritima TaxID=2026239 RepID=A0ABX9MVQ9_9BURK|nr:2-dehydropantoate 2-reductase [Neopusillimonas maritima]RII83039.1 2-dehydropantoate 2-reductase [Neopusillimonas maritima]|tara:strand:+ start:1934 stop:2854 length:921 start_codon:yes stop_codon:yes gene_type:complete
MKILMVGAGAVGGQFGAYLHESGADVHFLLRPARKEIIDKEDLTLDLPTGKVRIQPRTLTAAELTPNYELIVISCKAYSLDSVINDITHAIGEKTVILPLLNGLRHLEILGQKFGHNRVLGGIAKTVATLATPSCIQIKHGPGNITVGARTLEQQANAEAVAATLHAGGVHTYFSEHIMDDMWDKYCLMASLGAANCLLGGAVGEYMRSQAGGEIALQLFKECADTAAASGHPLHPESIERIQQALTNRHSGFSASMYRDMQAGLPVEGDHLVGDMMRRGESLGVACPTLKIAHAVLETYMGRRAP